MGNTAALRALWVSRVPIPTQAPFSKMPQNFFYKNKLKKKTRVHILILHLKLMYLDLRIFVLENKTKILEEDICFLRSFIINMFYYDLRPCYAFICKRANEDFLRPSITLVHARG